MWLENSTPRCPSLANSRSRSSTPSRAIGSKPAVASSSISRSAPCESATASCSFMPMPRDRSRTFAFGGMSNSSSKLAKRCASQRANAGATHAIACFTFSSAGKGHVSNTTPMRPRNRRCASAGAVAPKGWPNRRTLPLSRCKSPKIARIIVVLPAPFAPTKPTISPGCKAMFTSASAKSSLRRLPAPRTSKRVSMIVSVSSCATRRP